MSGFPRDVTASGWRQPPNVYLLLPAGGGSRKIVPVCPRGVTGAGVLGTVAWCSSQGPPRTIPLALRRR
jgi:hypothetical protein